MKTEFTDKEKIILNGRIYPAIQNCVNNRYKIIIGYFAIFGFLLINDDKLESLIDSWAVFFFASIFTIFVFHNSYNYWRNAKDQWKIEKENKRVPVIEIIANGVMTLLIWVGYWILKVYACTA